MTTTLFIRPYSLQPQRGDYLLLNKDNGILQEEQDVLLEDLESLAEQHPVVLIIPGMDILTASVSLPLLSSRKRQQAIPFALEEQLCEEIDTLHFVIGESEHDQWPVALINKSRLQQWIEPWQKQEVELIAAVPDFFGLPFSDHQWHIVITPTDTLIRMGKSKGLAIDTGNLLLFLKTAIAEPLTNLPDILLITLLAEDIPFTCSEFEALGIPAQFEQRRTSLLSLITPHITDQTLNLLKNEFTQHRKFSGNKKTIYGVAALAGFLLVCLMISQFMTYRTLVKKNEVLTQQIEALYHQAFPQATHVVAPEARFKQALKSLKVQQGTAGFLQLLAKTSNVFHKIASIQLKEVRFTAQQLLLIIEVDNFSVLETIMKELRSHGLSVTQNSASSKNNRVSATLLITGVTAEEK